MFVLACNSKTARAPKWYESRFVPLSLLLFLLSLGCAQMGALTAKELEGADYGSPIAETDAQRQATALIQRTLKDPESMRVEWGNLSQYHCREYWDSGKPIFGYALRANVNAKNSYGGYVGAKPWVFMFKNGQLFAAFAAQTEFSRHGSYERMSRIY